MRADPAGSALARVLATVLLAGALDGGLTGCGAGPERPRSAAGPITTVGPSGLAGGWHGVVPALAVPRPSFTLTDTAGRAFDFARATAGRATLLFFGYTNCPDVCPTTMADLAAAKQVAGPATAAKVTVVFVTTDPARDSRAVVRRWLDAFDPAFIGLTGSPDQIEAAERAVGMPIALTSAPGPAPTGPAPTGPAPTGAGAPGAGSIGGGYLVTHASQVLGFGPDDRAQVRYFAGTKVAEYVADLPRLVAAG